MKKNSENQEKDKIIGQTPEEKKKIMDSLFDTVRVPKMRNKLDPEGLIRLGFTEAVGSLKEKVYRIKPSMYYNKTIQVTLKNDLPRTNPNCGVVYIYEEEINDTMLNNKGETVPVNFPERIIPIAWYVDTYERLFSIITSLTQINIR